jgi:hypothetical protein
LLLGVALMRSGDLASSLPHLEWAVAERERMDAPQSPWLAEARLYLAQALHQAHHDKTARQQLALAQAAFANRSPLAPQYPVLLTETHAILSQQKQK